MLISSLCPKCQFDHGLSDKLLGETILCQQCGEPFVVVENVGEPEEQSFDVESTFHRDELVESAPSPVTKSKQKSLREEVTASVNLSLPPPPKELWSKKIEDDDERPDFRPFKHDSRAVQEFLERDQGSDYSWLLIAGLVVMTLVLVSFQCVLGLLIIW